MSQASTPFETTQGYAPPTVTQFSVFLTNKVGKLFDLVKAFDTPRCQICALSVHDATDHAVVRIITSKADQAKQILREHGIPYSEKDVLVVELSKGHTLTSLCVSLLSAELSIQFAYPLMLRPNGTPTIALSVEDPTLAGQILRRKEFRLFGEADLPDRPHTHDH
ncbi:MAG: acetolactate synthase [Phycisphaeraceae bacterium]|nr:MAG: acetolactate synthase [Phycisphaeraceae bacterium]